MICQIPCNGKDGIEYDSYACPTKNSVNTRLKQHSRDVQFDARTEKTGKTVVVHHFEQTRHIPDFKNARVLYTESFLSRRSTLEGLHIQNNHTSNLRRDKDKVFSLYCAQLEQHRFKQC